MILMILIFLPVDTRVCGRDGRREFRYVPVLQDSNLARSHRGAQALRPDHTRRGTHAHG